MNREIEGGIFGPLETEAPGVLLWGNNRLFEGLRLRGLSHFHRLGGLF